MIIELYKSRGLGANFYEKRLTLMRINLTICYKMFFIFISKQWVQSLWSRSVFSRVYRPRSIAMSCELARILGNGMRYLGKVKQSR